MILPTGYIKPSQVERERAIPFRALKMATRNTLPVSFALERTTYFDQRIPPVEMCLSCQLSEYEEYAVFREFGVWKRFAPAFAYGYRVKQTYQGEGMTSALAYQDFIDNGICEWQDLPVMGIYPVCKSKITPALIEKAKPQHALSVVCMFPDFWGWGGLNAEQIQAIKTYIYTTKMPVLFAMDVYRNSFNVGSDGIVKIPTKDDACFGTHAMLIYGWQGNYMLAKNSYGEKWGLSGDCLIPWNYPQWMDFWLLTDYIAPIIVDPPIIIDPPIPDKPTPPDILFTGVKWSYNSKSKKLSIKITNTKNYGYTIRTNGKKTTAKSFTDTKVIPGMTATIYGKDGSKAIIKV